MSGDFDVIVIGAGAAGIGAGRALAASGLSFTVLEARRRVGGRAWTQSVEGMALDHGCGWLHSAEENPWTALAERHGSTVDRTPPPWETPAANGGLSAGDRAEMEEAVDGYFARLDAAAGAGGPDRACAALLEPGNRWNPLLNAMSGYISGTALDDLSLVDTGNYHDTGTNWRVREGYGALVAAEAQGLPIRLGVAVRLIDRSGAQLRVETAAGVLTARAVIVTVPPSLLLNETLRFHPALPVKAMAAEGLPLGLADKVSFRVERAEELPLEGHVFGDPFSAETGHYHLRPFGRPVIEGFFGGALPRRLEREGAAACFAFAQEELVREYGSDFARRLTPLAVTGWASDPWSGGSYSYARPGHADARALLAAPVEDRLFFAGEACSTHDFSTAHGAWRSGQAAAAQVLAALLPAEEVAEEAAEA